MFLLFDTNRSGTLEIDEISNMFKSNGVYIKKNNLIKLFQMVDEDNSGTLTFNEFKEFMLSESRQKLFTNLMKKERDQQMQSFLEPGGSNEKQEKATEIEYLPLSADTMIRHLRYKTIRKTLYDEIFKNQKHIKQESDIISSSK